MPRHLIKTHYRSSRRPRGMYDYDSVVWHMKRRRMRFMLGLVFLVMLLAAAAILMLR